MFLDQFLIHKVFITDFMYINKYLSILFKKIIVLFLKLFMNLNIFQIIRILNNINISNFMNRLAPKN